MRTISQILLEDYSIRLRPGAKGECPQCHGHNFSIKHGDQLGKCFSPQCGYTLTAARDHEHAHASLPRVLDSVYEACHHALLDLASRPTSAQNAYRYLTEERGIHPQVVNDALLGVVPAGFDVRTHFQPVLADAEADVARLKREQRGRPTKQYETAAKRLTDLQETQQRLHECLAHKAAWLIFFYTDAHHRLVALRLRQPYTKKFVSFKPGSAGVFGRELFTPYVTPDKQPLNGFLLVVEGEFNVLQLQALMVRYEEATGETLGYLNACAVGGVLGADLDTLTRVAQHPVIVYDHDTNQAGFELVRRLQQVMPVEACTTPLPCGEKSDLDSYIRDFGQDHMAAWEGVKALMAARQPYGRIYAGTGEEFFDYPVTGKAKVFIPKLLADALMAQQHYRYTNPAIWTYQHGVYVRDEETITRACQALLGPEWTTRRRDEAIAYVQDARRLQEGTDGPPQYLNVRNGLYDLTTGRLGPHTPTYFSTVQLPMDYDPEAQCPTILAWFVETTRGDDAILEVLRAYLKAIVQGATTIQRILELVGAAGSGKGTYIRLAQALVGLDNTAITELKHLETSRFELAALRWKRLICITDSERYAGPIPNLKAMTGGDLLRMEEKFVQGRQERPADGLVLLAANEEVQSSDYTSGLGRRRLTVYFTHTPDVPRDLLSIHGRTFQGEFVPELPGLLTWVLAMPDATMHDLLSLKHQYRTPGLRANWQQTLLATNALAPWAHWHLILDDQATTNVGVAKKLDITTSEVDPDTGRRTATRETYYVNEASWLYANYVAYLQTVGHKPLANRRFARDLHDLLVHQCKVTTVRHTDDMYGSRFHGVRLRTAQDDAREEPLLLERVRSEDLPF